MRIPFRTIVPLTLLVITATPIVSAKTTTIRFLVGNVEAKEITNLCRLFEKDHPGIKVNPTVVSWDQVDNKFLAMTVGGTKIDVFCNNSSYGWARYTRQGLFSDLTPLATRDKREVDLNDFSPLVLDAYRYKGKLISLPVQHFLANSLSYNANLLNEAGLPLPPTSWETKSWNWEDMLTYTKKLTRTAADGKVTQWGIDFWNADNLISLAWAGGGDWLDAASYRDGIVNKVTINTLANEKAYQKVADLSTVYQVRPGVAKAKASSGADAFNKGEMAMWLDAQQLQNPANNSKKFKWGLAPFPAMESGNRTGFTWMEALAIPKASQNKEAAWTFVKWMSKYGSSSPNIKWPQNSARESMWDKALERWPMELSALSKAQLREFIKGGLKYAKALPRDYVFGSQAVTTAATTELSKAMNGKASVAQALNMAQRVADIEVRKYMRYK